MELEEGREGEGVAEGLDLGAEEVLEIPECVAAEIGQEGSRQEPAHHRLCLLRVPAAVCVSEAKENEEKDPAKVVGGF